MNNTNNFTARESLKIGAQVLYDSMRNKFTTDDECWNWVWGRKLTQGEVRLEVELNSTSNSFKFGLTDKQNNSNNIQWATERRLDMQDTLIVNEYAIYTGQTDGEVDDTEWELRTYGNTQDFGAVNAAILNQTFYSHGWYALMVNNDNVIPYRGLKNHKYLGQTQQTDALGAASPGDEFRGSEDAYITQEANLLLIGNKGYIPTINFPTNLAFAAETTGIRAIIIYSGILAQNSTILS